MRPLRRALTALALTAIACPALAACDGENVPCSTYQSVVSAYARARDPQVRARLAREMDRQGDECRRYTGR